MVKYGKSYRQIESLKSDYICNNMLLLDENKSIAEIYAAQPKRTKCKVCSEKLGNDMFYSHGLSYYHCQKCGHVNGEYEETKEFTSRIYEKNDYGKVYRAESRDNYYKRLKNIYLPKADFMIDALKDKSFDVEGAEFLDVGAGSGYFVGALQKLEVKVCGIEVSKLQVEYANKMLGLELVKHVSQEHIVDRIRETDASVISFIGVLEHIVNLHQIMEAIKDNDKVEYMFFSVPMFSYSVFLEAISPEVFNRLLGGTHTHIFSESSLEYLYKMYGWTSVAEWRFGTDIADLSRAVQIKMINEGNEYLGELFSKKISQVMDELQLVIDKQGFCSEIHVLLKKTNK